MKPEPYDSPVRPDPHAAEKQLLAELKNETPGAFEKFFHRYWQLIMRLCLARIPDQAEAEDIAIETFADAAKGLKKFRGESRLTSWLIRLALNRIAKHLRARSRRITTIPIQDCPEDAACTENHQTPPEISQLIAALNTLPEPDRLVLILRHINQLKLREIAEITHSSTGAVAMRLKRAEEKLRHQFTRRQK